MRVIGTAGHVDHGKSALVLALTGIDPDRLEEEKARGLTIDLGFAWLTLPNGDPVGIVDVPGHKDFIENMLAGVGSIDATLFVVAADEGVMPQTREHLAILDLLEIDQGVVAVTKVDLAESEAWVELVIDDLKDTLAGTVLEDAPIVRTSARTEEGLDELLVALEDVLAQTEPRFDEGEPRLPIDRVFTVSGFGTVVTGTLNDGYLEVGEEVEIQPTGLEARVRGLQTHQETIERAVPGSRVAINLSGVDKDQLARGDVVTKPGWLHSTTLLDVQMRYLPDILWPNLGRYAQRPLRHNTELKLYSGAAEVIARVRLLGQETLSPGQDGWLQLDLRDPVALVKGDRFILRLPSPPTTVGGGIIVDPHPGRKHRRFRSQVVERLKTLAEGSSAEILLQILERRGPTSADDLLSDSRLDDDAQTALAQLVDEDKAMVLSEEKWRQGQGLGGTERIVTRRWWKTQTEYLEEELADYHQRFPLRKGMPREALRSGLRMEPEIFDALLARAAQQGLLADEGATVRLSSHTVQFTPQQNQQVDELLTRFQRQPYTPPSVKDSASAVGEEVLNVLIDRGELVQVSDDVLFLSDTYQKMVEQVQNYIEQQGSVTLAETRDMFDSSRKYAQALLEHLDEAGVTKRVGDKRILRGA